MIIFFLIASYTISLLNLKRILNLQAYKFPNNVKLNRKENNTNPAIG